MSLSKLIQHKIETEGPLSFHDFMEMSLYYPGAGYYERNTAGPGMKGDFYTSPGSTPLFGEMIAKQLEEMWSLMDTKEFTIVEYGGASGMLCMDILRSLKKNKEFYSHLRYCIIEKNASRKKSGLCDKKISWHDHISEIGEISGCILSNELVDNFPVHRVVMKEKLMEIFVDYSGQFKELFRPASNTLCDYLSELQVTLPQDFCTEINLDAIKWIEELSAALKRGFIITIDYGYSSSELYNTQRRLGTLLCYYHHQLNDCPYERIGEQDITAHVNFSALQHWGKKNGLQYAGFTTQGHFLRALGLTNHIKKIETGGRAHDDQQKAFMIHTFLRNMGSRLKVLIQKKGISAARLSGLQFAQPLA